MPFKERACVSIAIAIVVGLTSWALHSPKTPIIMPMSPAPWQNFIEIVLNNMGLRYTDVVYGLFYPIFDESLIYRNGGDKWYNVEKLEKLVNGEKLCPIPYIDYKFEYPPIIGMLWYVSTCIAIKMGLPNGYNMDLFRQYKDTLAQIHYNIQSLITFAFFALMLIYILKILNDVGYSWRRALLLIVLPSTFLYMFYNWDVLCISLAVVGLYMYIRRRYILSGILLGLSVASKLLTIAILFTIIYDILQRYLGKTESLGQRSGTFIAISALSSSIPYAILYMLSPKGFTDFVSHHIEWYCENCLYILISNNIFNPLHRVLSMIIFTTAMILIIAIPLDSVERVLNTSFLAIVSTTLYNYVFSPQMFLLISPIALLCLKDIRTLILYSIADAANFGIMATFFTTQNPYTLPSTTQILASVRNLLLLILWIYTYVANIKLFTSKRSLQ